ncbi:hypothetical protein K2W90_00505 [Candidatus Babeliales bacterium]|nr:hypothetical protein [Candidatus Babeliales bacterium]
MRKLFVFLVLCAITPTNACAVSWQTRLRSAYKKCDISKTQRNVLLGTINKFMGKINIKLDQHALVASAVSTIHAGIPFPEVPDFAPVLIEYLHQPGTPSGAVTFRSLKAVIFKTIIDFCTENREEIKRSQDVVAWCLDDSDGDDDGPGDAQDFELVLRNKFAQLTIEGDE